MFSLLRQQKAILHALSADAVGTQAQNHLAACDPRRQALRLRGADEGREGLMMPARLCKVGCMHSLSSDRQRLRRRRRKQIRRRRLAALVVVFTLVVLAVWASSLIPSVRPSRVPDPMSVEQLGVRDVPGRAVVARLEGIDVILPVKKETTTAVAYHPVDNPNTVPFSPAGERVSGGDLAARLADVFSGGGGLEYHLMAGNGGDHSAATAGLDVGAVPGSYVFSPIDGHVTAVTKYELLGRYPDYEVDVQAADDASLLLVMTHLAHPSVKIGDALQAGVTPIGRLRAFPASLDQSLKQFTADAGDHVQVVALRVQPQMAGF